MASGNEMKVELPQEIITSIVRAQIVQALGKSEQLIEGVVKAALEQKKDSYSRTTVFEDQVTEMIRKEAVDAFGEWLTENREKVRAALRKELTAKKGKLVTDLVDAFTTRLSVYSPDIVLKFPENR